MLVTREERPNGGVVIKQASTDDEHRRLEREARLLCVAAHPGVVQLDGVESGTEGRLRLSIREVSGGDLGHCSELETEEVLGVGAAVATTLADLHELGISHGALEADHVLIDADGRPLLCSLGRGKETSAPADSAAAARQDVADLALLLAGLLRDRGPRGVNRVLDAARNAGTRRSPSARSLARALGDPTTGARLPMRVSPTFEVVAHRPDGEIRDQPPPPTAEVEPLEADPRSETGQHNSVGLRWPRRQRSAPSRRRARVWTARAFTLALTVTALVLLIAVTSHSDNRAATAAAVACPAADDGCGPVATLDGVLDTPAGRFQVGQPGDVVVLGRWSCGGVALPALLRPGTGRLWVFDRWASDSSDVTGRPVGTVAGARSLRVLPSTSGCDHLEVLRSRGQHPQLLTPGGSP